jgi:hypothetical protein
MPPGLANREAFLLRTARRRGVKLDFERGKCQPGGDEEDLDEHV